MFSIFQLLKMEYRYFAISSPTLNNKLMTSEEEVNMSVPLSLHLRHLNQSAVYVKLMLEVIAKSGLSQKTKHPV